VTGGIITVKDSKWLMSYTLNRQPHFKDQPKDQLVVWVYGLFTDVPGDYVKNPCGNARGGKLRRSGFTIWEYLWKKSRIWRLVPHTAFPV